jgi:hypothetical protein
MGAVAARWPHRSEWPPTSVVGLPMPSLEARYACSSLIRENIGSVSAVA